MNWPSLISLVITFSLYKDQSMKEFHFPAPSKVKIKFIKNLSTTCFWDRKLMLVDMKKALNIGFRGIELMWILIHDEIDIFS